MNFSPEEAAYLVDQYEALETPFSVDYVSGWQQLYEYSPTAIMLLALVLCFLIAGIFSQEGQYKTDAIFFSTCHGRGKGTAAKVKTGLLLLTVLYWVPFLLFAGLTLGLLGADGANCPVQLVAWKSFYNITLWQGGLPFAIIFVPAMLMRGGNALLNDILGLLPDKLLQLSRDLSYFDLYQIGDRVTGAIPVLFILYLVLTVLLVPLLYHTYKRKQLK